MLTRAQLDALPNRVNVWSIARVIPSVTLDKVDVGGSESFLNSTATVHGTSTENKYMIGANQANPASTNFLQPGTKWDLERAVTIAREYQRMNVMWLEEPLPRYDFDDATSRCC